MEPGTLLLFTGFVWLGIFFYHAKRLDEEKYLLEQRYKNNFDKQKRELEATRQKTHQEHQKYLTAITNKERRINEIKRELDVSIIRGRNWLAQMIAEATSPADHLQYVNLLNRKAPKAAEQIKAANAAKRALKKQLKFLEYQIKTYHEYFPQIEEYQEAILNDVINFKSQHINTDTISETDPVTQYLSKQEYHQLDSVVRNQLALDRYIERNHSNQAIGLFYERYIGYLYETKGYDVQYHGATKGLEDLGRDLICTKGNEILIVQAKNWSHHKLIHEKHIFQLFGTCTVYLIHNDLPKYQSQIQKELWGNPQHLTVKGILITATELSDVAKAVAERLDINYLQNQKLDKNYPMIKCVINNDSRIYHLPIDQQYDKIKMSKVGRHYVKTVAEAEKAGYRRAYRHRVISH